MDNLIKFFEKTYVDKVFTRDEEKEIRSELKKSGLSEHEKDLLRSKIFDLVNNDFTENSQAISIKWLEEAVKLLMKAETSDETTKIEEDAFFSPGDDCLNEIIKQLRSAKKSVDICVFTISDNRISDEILNCFRRKVNVRLLTDNDKTKDKGSDIHWLADKGLQIKIDRTDNHMHHKFAIIDSERVITGSYNWTRSAAMYNEENILVSNNPELTIKYMNEFNKLWGIMGNYK